MEYSLVLGLVLDTRSGHSLLYRLPATYSACERVIREALARNQWDKEGVRAQTPPMKHRPGTYIKWLKIS
jgi:hypothetical protein